jgi:uncharacterized protein
MAGQGTGRCPMCGKPAAEKFKPFCSSRCMMLDLGKWLGEGYRLPADENDEEEPSLPSAQKGEECE